jgi:peptidyl-tRNA hydrolase
MRLRFGVGHPGDKKHVHSYVLKEGRPDVEAAVEQEIGAALRVLPLLTGSGLNAAMKELHTKNDN